MDDGQIGGGTSVGGIEPISATRGGQVLSAPLAARGLVTLALLVGVAGLDLATGSEVSFSIFYLVPVSFAGAFISRGAGFVVATLSAGA